MSGEPQLYRVDPENQESEKIQEVEFSQLGLQERRDIQEWVAANPGILGDEFLIIGKEFSGFDRTNDRLDLLAVDRDGKLVIIELKRDDTGADAHWQAIKYASYFQHASEEAILGMMAGYTQLPEEETRNRLIQHLGADDLNALNNDQRIILASHRFAPEVTTAALWLNKKVADMITCVQLTPYRDSRSGTLYVQASTIIPVPGMDKYLVGVGQSQHPERSRNGSFQVKLAESYAESRNHETTPFVQRVSELALSGLPDEIRPNRTGRWAGNGGDRRYYHLWYSRVPWGNWKVHYAINLYPREEADKWSASISFDNREKLALPALDSITLETRRNESPHGIYNFVTIGPDTLNENFASQIAEILRDFIVHITPIIDDFGNGNNEGDEP